MYIIYTYTFKSKYIDMYLKEKEMQKLKFKPSTMRPVWPVLKYKRYGRH